MTNYKIDISDYETKPAIGFLAPFYLNSPFIAESQIMNLIDSAKKSIKIIAQHICPIDYELPKGFHSKYEEKPLKRNGFLNNLIKKARDGVKVSFLSQTFSSGDKEFDSKFRSPINKGSFIQFYNAIKDEANIFYGVNENIHSKYIIVDDKVFISSFNYTPTQFIYLDKVNIPEFINNPGKSYRGIYSETGQYCIISNIAIVNEYEKNFTDLCNRKETIIVKE